MTEEAAQAEPVKAAPEPPKAKAKVGTDANPTPPKAASKQSAAEVLGKE